MQNIQDLFSSEGDSIDIAGIESLVKISKYHPQKPDKFFSGLELAEDLADDQRVTLYTKGTTITPDRVKRLLHLNENKPDFTMQFKIKRSAELIANFKKDILTKLQKLTEHKKGYKVYAQLIGSIDKDIQAIIDEILSEENIILTVYKMKFAADTSEYKNATLFFNHTVSVALFSYAVANTPELKDILNFTKEDYSSLLKVAFFHNIGALTTIDSIISAGSTDQVRRYNEANRNSGYALGSLQLSFDIMDAIRYVGEYAFERYDFIDREDSKACWFANVVVAADFYAQFEVGLFGNQLKPSIIIDRMNILARDDQLNKNVVKAFTIGLNLKDIFDFYQEMDRLQNMCTFKGGKHAWPYPMTGHKSPTLFICQADLNDCEYYEPSLKAVSLLQPMGKLKEGKYVRCLLTSPKLQEFYQEHYEDIKSDIKDTSQQKK